jgi:hypothetical protein
MRRLERYDEIGPRLRMKLAVFGDLILLKLAKLPYAFDCHQTSLPFDEQYTQLKEREQLHNLQFR